MIGLSSPDTESERYFGIWWPAKAGGAFQLSYFETFAKSANKTASDGRQFRETKIQEASTTMNSNYKKQNFTDKEQKEKVQKKIEDVVYG